MRIATVVLPVPGLPVKLMCRVGGSVARPSLWRARSTTSSAAVSRMRRFTGARPISSRSSASSTSATPEAWKSAFRSMRSGGASSGGPASTGWPSAITRALRLVGGVGLAGVVDRAAGAGAWRMSLKPGSSAGRLTMKLSRTASHPWVESKATSRM